MTPREAGIQAFYADESTSNTLQGLNAAFDAYEVAKPDRRVQDILLEAAEAAGAKANDLRHDDASRRGYMFAAHLIRSALSKAKEGQIGRAHV